MKRLLLILSAVIVVSGAVSFGITHYSQARSVPVADTIAHVSLMSDHANPSVVSIKKGSSVQFDSKDNLTHNIGQGRGDDGSETADHTVSHDPSGAEVHEHIAGTKESGDFGGDEAYKVQFDTIGTYYFHDHLHPKISIAVVVYEPTSR